MLDVNLAKSNSNLKQKSDDVLQNNTNDTDSSSLENNSAAHSYPTGSSDSDKKLRIVEPYILITKKLKHEFTGHLYLLVLYMEIKDRMAWGDYPVHMTKKTKIIKKGEWHTSMKELSEILNKDHRHVRRQLAILEKMGLIAVTRPNARAIIIMHLGTCYMSAEQASYEVPKVEKAKKSTAGREICGATAQHRKSGSGQLPNIEHDGCGATAQHRVIPSLERNKVFNTKKNKNLDSEKLEQVENKTPPTLEDERMSNDSPVEAANIPPLNVMVLPAVDTSLAWKIEHEGSRSLLKDDVAKMLDFANEEFKKRFKGEMWQLEQVRRARYMQNVLHWRPEIIRTLTDMKEW